MRKLNLEGRASHTVWSARETGPQHPVFTGEYPLDKLGVRHDRRIERHFERFSVSGLALVPQRKKNPCVSGLARLQSCLYAPPHTEQTIR